MGRREGILEGKPNGEMGSEPRPQTKSDGGMWNGVEAEGRGVDNIWPAVSTFPHAFKRLGLNLTFIG